MGTLYGKHNKYFSLRSFIFASMNHSLYLLPGGVDPGIMIGSVSEFHSVGYIQILESKEPDPDLVFLEGRIRIISTQIRNPCSPDDIYEGSCGKKSSYKSFHPSGGLPPLTRMGFYIHPFYSPRGGWRRWRGI